MINKSSSSPSIYVHITLKVSMHFCLNSVTFFWLDFARHFCSLIRPMTIVWFIQQLHWAVTSSVSFWHLQLIESYSGEDKTSVESLGGDFSINNALNPRNLGAKWKLLISRFQNSSWMLDLELNWPSYDRETKPNFSLKFMFLSYSYRFTSID